MSSRTRPRINRDGARPRIDRDIPRPSINRDVQLAALGEVRHRHRRDDVNFFKIPEVAERLRVSTRTVRRWIDDGRLIAHRIAGIRIAENDLRAFLALHREG
jgi:excisionase family DNA binding protein